ncbi:MAG TPA: HEAT repeat domain-containing protein [Polyangia bacterium]|nr:HEAT repeat domain-containing protein [Polyangia bacterium]
MAALLAALGCKSKPAPQVTPAPAIVAPLDATALYNKGKAALENRMLSEAVDDFTKATTSATDPDLRANAWLGLGAAYGELGDHTRAVAAYEQVTVLRPDDADAWRVLAEGMAAAGKRDKQAAALEHVIAIEPDDLAAYLDLAGVDVAIGKAEQSKDVYVRYEGRRRDAVVQLGKSKDPAARAAAADALSGARDAGTARALVLALTDKDPGVRIACAEALGRIGVDIDAEVRPAMQAMLKREPDDKVRAAVEAALAN